MGKKLLPKIKFPTNICFLDIETKKTNFKNNKKSELGLVGTMVYQLQNGKYYQQKHKHYMPTEISDLEKFLKTFPGIIIGHNIFGFDYSILRYLMHLEGIIEKSVDTLWFLYNKRKEVSGAGLDNLGKLNFGSGKTENAKDILKYFDENIEDVILYNKNDLLLTKKVWWQMVSKKKINVGIPDDPMDDRQILGITKTWTDTVIVSNRDILKLIGEKSTFNFKSWSKRIGDQKKFLPNILPIGGWKLNKARFLVYCKTCRKTKEYSSSFIFNRFSSRSAKCGRCNTSLGKISIDPRYNIKMVQEYKGHFSMSAFYHVNDPNSLVRNYNFFKWLENYSDFPNQVVEFCSECGEKLTLPARFYILGHVHKAKFLCKDCLKSKRLLKIK